MIKKDHAHGTMVILAFIVVIAIIIGVIDYTLKYVKTFKKDIMANDVEIEILRDGTGVPAKVGDEVVVNYVGTLESGFEFDNSYKRGQAFPVTLGEGRVIKGWEVGLLGIKAGEKRKLTIPPTMGYGSREIPNLIPANSFLIFDIEAIEIHPHG
jgi:FKBP-type peptidyl-prolyl cis-trans isomerase